MILEQLEEASRRRVTACKEAVGIREMEQLALKSSLGASFLQALKRPGLSFICEVKKASPSKGIIAEDFPYVEIAKDYEEAGADAISVLTEPEFFLGKGAYLREIHEAVRTPLLRKDFVVDVYQIYEARALGASAVLLICSILKKEQLKEYISLGTSLGLELLVEAHTEAEVSMAAEAGASIIGVNNRDLKTFQVDVSNALRLKQYVDPGTIFVAESGIRGPEDIKLVCRSGADAVLIGETLMRAKDRKACFRELRRAAEEMKG